MYTVAMAFNVFMDNVVREARRECIREVVISTGTVGLLMFADDMVMMAEMEEALQHNPDCDGWTILDNNYNIHGLFSVKYFLLNGITV